MPRSRTPVEDSSTRAVFTEESLKFLRGIVRNNDREWFEARRGVYESALRAPMLALIAQVNEAMADFAPEHIKTPEKTVLRIYRDTRFSNNKQPYKQHYAAWWGRSGMQKTSGAGYYFHIAAKTLTIAAGLYMPDPVHLLAVRRYLLDHHEELRAAIAAGCKSPKPKSALKPAMQISERHALTRAPKGFPADHPANDLVFNRNWAVEAELDSAAVLDLNFAKTLVSYFRLTAPVVEFLNRPLNAEFRSRKALFALPAY